MSIKNQLRAAILSGGAKGSAEDTSTSIQLSTLTNYTAPADGAVYAHAVTNLDGATTVGLSKNRDFGSSISFKSANGWNTWLNLPVRKGDSVSFASYNNSVFEAYFVKLVGGGVKTLWHSLFGGLCHA